MVSRVNREKFLSIHGRRRTIQLELAKKYGIKAPPVGGGCLLCEPKYCQKLKPILKTKINFQDVKLVNIGRHFPGIILGRRERENNILELSDGIKIIPQDNPGPTALIQDKNLIEEAKELINKYSKKKINEFEIK